MECRVAAMPPLAMLVGRAVERRAQSFEVGCQVEWMIADEESPVVREIGVGQRIDRLVIIMTDHVMAGDAAAGDDAISDIRLLERREHLRAAQPGIRSDD